MRPPLLALLLSAWMLLSPLALAAGETPAFFGEVTALLVVSALIAYGCFRLGLLPIIGFLVAGVLIGPNALGLVRDPALIDAAAELGVILLLFTIGIEFSLEKLARIRRLIFVGGGLQVGLTVAAVTLLLLAFGVDWRLGVFTGCLVALSSTAIVLKLLEGEGATDTGVGSTSVGILIFQDLAVVAMVLLVPMLGAGGGSALGLLGALVTAGAIIALVLTLATRVMPRILEAVARTCSQEIFLLSVVAICLGTAYLTSLAGVSLSLGAFLAGLLVSESRFGQQALGEILPLQILFSAAFFLSVGLLLDLGFLVTHLPAVLAAILGILVLKTVLTAASARALGQPLAVALPAGLLLAQVGEFSFVLERAGRSAGLSPAGLGEAGAQTFIAATVLLMGATPFLAGLGRRLERRLAAPRAAGLTADAPPAAEGAADLGDPVALQDHVIVAGYGDAARRLTQVLDRAGLPYLILTLSPTGATEAEARGRRVVRGDYAKSYLLEHAGVRRARLLVIPDDEPNMTHRVVSVARNLSPELHILASTRAHGDAHALKRAGASAVVSEEHAATKLLITGALDRLGLDADAISSHLEALNPNAPAEGEPMPLTSVTLSEAQQNNPACAHARGAHPVTPSGAGCQECLQTGDTWVHLRVCMSCGHVGCCDSSKNKHATKHAHGAGHPVIRSFEPGETWAYCYEDKVTL